MYIYVMYIYVYMCTYEYTTTPGAAIVKICIQIHVHTHTLERPGLGHNSMIHFTMVCHVCDTTWPRADCLSVLLPLVTLAEWAKRRAGRSRLCLVSAFTNFHTDCSIFEPIEERMSASPPDNLQLWRLHKVTMSIVGWEVLWAEKGVLFKSWLMKGQDAVSARAFSLLPLLSHTHTPTQYSCLPYKSRQKRSLVRLNSKVQMSKKHTRHRESTGQRTLFLKWQTHRSQTDTDTNFEE